MSQYFFTYGSFAEGQVHFPKISQFIISQKKSFLKASALRLSCGYPIINLEDQSSLVPGIIVELNIKETFWSILDALLGVDMSRPEKNIFHRQSHEVFIDNYSKISCQVYCLNNQFRGGALRLIDGGNWQKDMAEWPPLVEHLNHRHRDYMVQLTQSKGRDVVPIKMDLYRELLSLELIVDKGRRVALTKLGKEVSLFLQ